MALRKTSESNNTCGKQEACSGFTLPEVLIALGLFALLAGVGLSATLSGYLRGTLRDDETRTTDVLLRAREEAMHAIAGSSYGVRVDTNVITLFRGSSYATRDAGFDETYARSAPGVVQQPVDIIFVTLTGESKGGSIVFSSSDGTAHQISVNTAGGILED